MKKAWSWDTQGGTRKTNTPESLLARCVPTETGCLVWTGSMHAAHNEGRRRGPGHPQASLSGYLGTGQSRQPIDLRRFFYKRAGRIIPRYQRVMAVCGEPRCLNAGHMVAGRTGVQQRGVMDPKRAEEILTLYLEGLDAVRAKKARTLAAIGDRYGLTRERIRQIVASAIGIEYTALKGWARAYLSKPYEDQIDRGR